MASRAAGVKRPTAGVPWWFWPVGPLFLVSGFFSLIDSPDDVTLGPSIRIFYIHIGSAVAMTIAYAITCGASILYLRRRRLVYDRWAVASAEVGTFLAALVLISGTIWGRAAWNTWWTWDPKVTTTLILWVLFLGYFLLREWSDNPERRRANSAVLAIIAFLDVPVVYGASRWWNSIHPNIVTADGFNMPTSMLVPMFIAMGAFLYLAAVWMVIRLKQAEAEDALAEVKDRLRSSLDLTQ
jgi:heme exporter protein C